MKNEFLTEKCRGKPIMTVIAVAFLIGASLFLAAGVSAFFDDGDIPTGIVCTVITLVLLVPLVLRIIDILRVKEATAIAQKLGVVTGRAISGAEFERIYGIKNAAKRIERLNRGKYLSGVTYDPRGDRIIFTDRKDAEYTKRAYVCPNCGASGELEPYAPAKCEYCGRFIDSFVKV